MVVVLVDRRSGANLGVVLLLALVALAPASDKPEQISAVQVEWNAGSQGFDVDIAVKRSMLLPGGGCSSCAGPEVRINAMVEVQQDGAIPVVSALDYPMPSPRSDPAVPERGFVPVAPIRIPWDRNSGQVTGDAIVPVVLELVGIDGVSFPGASAHKTALLIFL
jgi:hypothetical protein